MRVRVHVLHLLNHNTPAAAAVGCSQVNRYMLKFELDGGINWSSAILRVNTRERGGKGMNRKGHAMQTKHTLMQIPLTTPASHL